MGKSCAARPREGGRYAVNRFRRAVGMKIAIKDRQGSNSTVNKAANQALATKKTATALGVVLARMYTLRNQLVHGGATWNSSVNRDQIRDCTAFLGKLVPIVITLMMDHPETLWGDACYPVVDAD